jgi:nicotinate phosphoribosyltransferase
MIQSILDNDLYKFTMQQAVLIHYPLAQAEYTFTNRGTTPFPPGFAQRVNQEIDKMTGLCLSKDQKAYLNDTCSFLRPSYLDYLENYSFNPDEVTLGQEKERFFLTIKGPWHKTILWEVPVMAIISETFFSMTDPAPPFLNERKERNQRKAAILAENQIYFADFGTRRRF